MPVSVRNATQLLWEKKEHEGTRGLLVTALADRGNAVSKRRVVSSKAKLAASETVSPKLASVAAASALSLSPTRTCSIEV